ncbi:MAG: SIR2 family protein [Candidatus Thiodiazotropha endolucinida]
MRFVENGPIIPDDLLTARDEGRVVFFCGAGVSRARAGLVDFYGLADKVIQKLGCQKESLAFQTLKIAGNISKNSGTEGLISTDRVFGLLENEFYASDIEHYVAEVLKPIKNVDTSAHRYLIDLATTPEGRVRLVTTNFDKLFNDCGQNLKSYLPPNLPDPSRHSDMDGVIYLHGQVNDDYSGSKGDGFILSSSDFGRAYLSDRWATDFIKEIFERYYVVFVGYSADDPPVRYLLEALNKDRKMLNGVYAFQSGLVDDAKVRWSQKGVKIIHYSGENGHESLWISLEKWAERAKNKDKWFQSVIDLSLNGPSGLKAHERGQVAHIISTTEGARKFASNDQPPPAEWLCVFDPGCRYEKPGYNRDHESDESTYIDPFDIYGIDSDTSPKRIDPDNLYSKREIPDSVWDAFSASGLDLRNLHMSSYSAVRGNYSVNMPELSPRLELIGIWISRVSDQPASIWWASKQIGIHPDIRKKIKWGMERDDKNLSTEIYQSWNYLFDTWDMNAREIEYDRYGIEESVNKYGWNNQITRKYLDYHKPYVIAKSNIWNRVVPPLLKDGIKINELLTLEVKYNQPLYHVDIPNEWLVHLLAGLRKNLELSLTLEGEVNYYILNNIDPIVDENQAYLNVDNIHGLIILFIKTFNKLVREDKDLAHKEYSYWLDDETIFTRLKIWACGVSDFITGSKLADEIHGFNNSVFWNSNHQADLMAVLRKRWNDIEKTDQILIENRIKEGPDINHNEDATDYEERKAWLSMNRIKWMSSQGCDLSFDVDSELQKLKKNAPNWKAEDALQIDSSGIRDTSVVSVTDCKELLEIPIKSILSKAVAIQENNEDIYKEYEPYVGLAKTYPVRAFSALSIAAKENIFPEWAWRIYLNSYESISNKPRLIALIAWRVSKINNEKLIDLLYSLSNWLSNISNILSSEYPESFDAIVLKLIEISKLQQPIEHSKDDQSINEHDWVSEAINHPVGMIAQALFKDSRLTSVTPETGLPDRWTSIMYDLLSLKGKNRLYTIVINANNLGWLHAIDSEWAEINIISILDKDREAEQDAIWSGFCTISRLPNKSLIIRLKSKILELLKRKNEFERKYNEVFSSILLSGWVDTSKTKTDRLFSSEEVRYALLNVTDDFRSHLLWKYQWWLSKDKKDDGGEEWSSCLFEFFNDVWPRQKFVISPMTSYRIISLAIYDEKQIVKLVDLLLPRLTVIGRDQFNIGIFQKKNIVDKYPSQILSIIYIVLPENPNIWPYEIEDILIRIGEADTNLLSDERLLELKRKWHAR